MSRTKSDPRVRRIVRSLDRAAASPHYEHADLPATILGPIASTIITLRSNCEEFMFDNWTTEQIRALVLGYALNAPEKTLNAMARIADEQVQWCEHWDAVGWYEGAGHAPLFASEAEARRWAS